MECILACSAGEEALRLLPKVKPDVVLMDIVLPGMSGIECTSRLVAALPAVEIIMITVYHDSDLIFGALRAGRVRLSAQTIVARGGDDGDP